MVRKEDLGSLTREQFKGATGFELGGDMNGSEMP